jgi:type 2 lantibiotic biosynthesis protein LanM
MVANSRPSAFPILEAELRAMEQLDVPYFEASATASSLAVGAVPPITDYFKAPSFEDALKQIETLSENDLARQTAIIHGSFDARTASTASIPGGRWTARQLPTHNRERYIAEAMSVASDLEGRAIPDVDGSLSWIGLGYLPQAERFQLEALGHSLVDGRSGIALFLAALAHVTADPGYTRLAVRTLQPLRRQIQTLDESSRARFAQAYGIGGASGLASLCYSLVKCATWLEDESLLSDAVTVCNLITKQRIAEDRHLDVMSGAAGTILGILPLYRATRDPRILDVAVDCARHLIEHQQRSAPGARAWQTQWDRPLTGFSHGAAGIAYALLRLYSVTRSTALHESAMQGIEYERSVFSHSQSNWPDFRRNAFADQHECATKWCHGATGIGLARVGSLPLTDDPRIKDEIEIALQTTVEFDLHAIDHLCCGNLGRIETLLVAGQRLAREDWTRIAHLNAANVIARAQERHAYHLFPNLPTSVFHPGFFAGTAGIGYQLLRLADADLPCVLLWE